MMMLKMMFRAAAWLTVIAIVVVTLGSPDYRPTTEMAHDLEHALAFATVGLMFALAYPAQRLGVALAAIPAIGILEAMQMWVPGRHARLEDFVVNLATFWLVLAIVSVALALVESRRIKAASSL